MNQKEEFFLAEVKELNNYNLRNRSEKVGGQKNKKKKKRLRKSIVLKLIDRMYSKTKKQKKAFRRSMLRRNKLQKNEISRQNHDKKVFFMFVLFV